MFFSENDISMSGSEYIRFLYQSTNDGKLTVAYDEDDAVTYPMAWDAQAAEELAQQFETLRGQLEAIGKQYDALMVSTEGLPEELLAVWNTYVRPFPDHNMDKEVLEDIWQKEDLGEELTESEKRIARLHRQWYEAQCLQRLPYNRCAPTGFINRAKRYASLVKLDAPGIVLETEARCLAEEMVLYYCMNNNAHICRCCGNAYDLEPCGGFAEYSICPTCMWEEDDTPEAEYSDTNGASLQDYRKAFFFKVE